MDTGIAACCSLGTEESQWGRLKLDVGFLHWRRPGYSNVDEMGNAVLFIFSLMCRIGDTGISFQLKPKCRRHQPSLY